MFEIELWNHYIAAGLKLPKTTNACEGYHSALNSLFSGANPTVWTLFNGLMKDMNIHDLEIKNVLFGRQRNKKKKYEDLAERLSQVVNSYEESDDKLRYLKRISWLS